MFNVSENIKNIQPEEWIKIEEAVNKTYRKMMWDRASFDYLVDLFIKNVEPNFTPSCSKCRNRVAGYWKQRLENYKTL